MTEDEHKLPPNALGKLNPPSASHDHLKGINPNMTMFGMPNLARSEVESSDVGLEQRSVVAGPGGYHMGRKPKVTADGSTSDKSLVEPSAAAKRETTQHSALMEMLLEEVSWDDALGSASLEPSWGLEEFSKLQTRYDDIDVLSQLAHEDVAPLTEEDLFGDQFPEDESSQGVRASWYGASGFDELRQTSPGQPRTTSPGLDDATTPSSSRYYLLCEEADGSERRVLLDASLVKLVAQLIFERPA